MKIEIKSIKKSYGKKQVLKDVNLTINSGKCIGILGGNGCGKSTLLSILAGIQRPTDGSFLYDGNNLFDYPKERAKLIGYVPQGNALIPELTAKDNLSLWYDKNEIKKGIENGMLKNLGIDEFINLSVSKMSGGMKKRLSIACSIAKNPPVLLLDEPMAALDIACKIKISDYITSHKKAGGIALLVTHDIMELDICDEFYILKDGYLTPFDYTGDIKKIVESL